MANFILEQCSSATQFTVGFGVSFTPMTGETYSFSDGLTGETICGTVISGTASPTTYSAMTLYDNCHECIIDIPRSANTEENICIEICDPSGNTVTSVPSPHPVWTDNYGTEVTQLNAITLGGQNGLNN
jgi:hypothetical protein